MKFNIDTKLSLKVMYMVIVMRNSIYVNINIAILYVDIIYIMIKYQYLNVICCFILVSFYYYCIFMLPRHLCLSNFNITWCPPVYESEKDCFGIYNLLFTNGRRKY